MTTNIQKICSFFGVSGVFAEVKEIPNGNINKTLCCKYIDDGKATNYILQKINVNVFSNPVEMMKNIDAVTSHIENKIENSELAGKRQVLRYFKTADENFCYVDEDGGYWRLCPFIEKSVTYNISNDPAVLFSTGKAFGEFQMQLSDFDASQLYEIIPDFHNTKKRLDNFFDVVESDPCGRASEAVEEIKYFESVRAEASKLTDMLEAGEIPLRVTHNDTKCNNVLFDAATNEPLAVIDLDTVMPGLAMHDFGDAVRSAANTAAEDEKDLSKVWFDLELFKAFADGFIGQTAHALTKKEIETMPLGAFTIAVELASRFLGDYINGDKYFKIDYDEHNLDRARCQIKLAKDMAAKYDDMLKIVTSIN